MMSIRMYRPGDEDAAYYVCMKTGGHGKDGEPFFRDDPDALGRIYVGPYLKFSPEFAIMVEDAGGVVGYALATPDTKTFFNRYENEWRPDLVAQFPPPTGDSSTWDRVKETHNLYHNPDYFSPEPYDQYPAHLHIDLLPQAQGQGYGRKMIERLLDLLQNADVAGVHLGMSAVNEPAYGFYKTLGFHELCRDDESIYMGKVFQEVA